MLPELNDWLLTTLNLRFLKMNICKYKWLLDVGFVPLCCKRFRTKCTHHIDDIVWTTVHPHKKGILYRDKNGGNKNKLSYHW